MNESKRTRNDSSFLKTLAKHIASHLEERSFCVIAACLLAASLASAQAQEVTDVTHPGHYVKQQPSHTRPIQKPADRPVPKAIPVDSPRESQHEMSPDEILAQEKALIDQNDRERDRLDELYIVWLGLPFGSSQYYAISNQLEAGHAQFRWIFPIFYAMTTGRLHYTDRVPSGYRRSHKVIASE